MVRSMLRISAAASLGSRFLTCIAARRMCVLWMIKSNTSLDRYEACPESKDTSRVGRYGNFLCLLWQHCRRPWSFTCEPCSFDNGRTDFEWDVFEMAAPIQSPAKCEVRSAIWTKRMGSALKYLTRYAQEGDDFLDCIVTGDKTWGFHHTPESSTMMRCKKKSWRGSKGWRQTSMTRGYGSWFQYLIDVWTMPATMLKNEVMYRQFIHSVAFVN